jgi:hypothetical protein
MGRLRDWLDRQQTSAAVSNDQLLSRVADEVNASKARREEGERQLYEAADASRRSNGGNIPDEIVDEQLRSYEESKRQLGL